MEHKNELEKTTLFSSKCYKVDVRVKPFNEVHHIIEAVLDTRARPSLVISDIILSLLIPLICQTKTFLESAEDTTIKGGGVTSLPIDFGGKIRLRCVWSCSDISPRDDTSYSVR